VATQPAGPPPYTTTINPEIAKLPPAPLTPKSAADLKAIQERLEAVEKFSLPAVVGVTVSDGQGSGVIVSKDGWVLTAGHVSGTPGAPITIVLSNGTRVRATAMGANNGIDSGMIKINTPGDYPFVPVGTISNLKQGDWLAAMGHPGGYQQGRQPVLRLGRLLTIVKNSQGPNALATDCTLIQGDSGGPVFDLDGRLVGINSRIGVSTTQNLHVPIDTFTQTWDRLARGEEWGSRSFVVGRGGQQAPDAPTASLGVVLYPGDTDQGPQVNRVRVGKASENILQADDIITRLDGRQIKTGDDLVAQVARHKVGDTVNVTIVRNGQNHDVKITLGSAE